jgi:hypothetical protein
LILILSFSNGKAACKQNSNNLLILDNSAGIYNKIENSSPDKVKANDQKLTMQAMSNQENPPYITDFYPTEDTLYGYVRFVMDMQDPGSASYSINSGDTVALKQAGNTFFSDIVKPSNGACQVDFYLEDSLGNYKTKTIEFKMLSQDANMPIELEGNRYFLNPFKRPNPDSLNYYGSGDVDGDGDIDSEDVNLAGAYSYIEVPNPDYICANSADDDNTECADICEGTASECLILNGERNKALERADVDGDGNVSSADKLMISEYYNSDNSIYSNGDYTEHLPGHWEKLDSAERISWIEKMTDITRADDYIFKANEEGFENGDCVQFRDQTIINLNGSGRNIAGYYNYSSAYKGRFNLPVISIGTITDGGNGHTLNGIYIGSKSGSYDSEFFTNFDNWYFFQPQLDNDYIEITPNNYSMDSIVTIENGIIDWNITGEITLDGVKEPWNIIRKPLKVDSVSPAITTSKNFDGNLFNRNNDLKIDWEIWDGNFLYSYSGSKEQDLAYPIHDGSFLNKCYYIFNGKLKNMKCFVDGSEITDVYSTKWLEELEDYYQQNGNNISLHDSIVLNQTEGKNRLVIAAKDIAGNLTYDTSEWIMDSHKPRIKLSNTRNEIFINEDSLLINVYDAFLTSAYYYKDDSSSITPGNTYQVNVPDEGKDSVRITARDTANNVKDTLINFICDRTSPQWNIEYPNERFPSKKLLVANIEDLYPEKKGYSLNSADTTYFASDTANLPVDDGEYNIMLTALDSAGNVSDTTLKTVFDTKKPDLVITGLKDKFYNHPPTGTFEANDPYLKDYGYKIDNEDFVSYSDSSNVGSFSFKLSEGSYSIEFSAIDSASNNTTTTHNIIIDKTSPVINIQSPEANGKYNDQITVEYSIDEQYPDTSWYAIIARGTTDTVYTDGDTSTTYENRVNLENGEYNIVFNAKDKAGNDTSLTKNFTVGSVGINDPDALTSSEIQVYPNPTSDKLTIEIKDLKKEAEIKILNLTGKLVYEGKMPSGNNIHRVNLSEYPNGIYFIEIGIGNKQYTKEVILDGGYGMILKNIKEYDLQVSRIKLKNPVGMHLWGKEPWLQQQPADWVQSQYCPCIWQI